jgi:hypothetical protein
MAGAQCLPAASLALDRLIASFVLYCALHECGCMAGPAWHPACHAALHAGMRQIPFMQKL